MLDHDQGRCRALGGVEHRVAYPQRALRVNVGCGFIQQHQPRAHGQDPGQGQALLLSPGQLLGGVFRRQLAQPDRLQCQGNAPGNLLRVHPEVFRPEGHVVLHPGLHDLGFRVLLHQAHTLARPERVLLPHQQLPGAPGQLGNVQDPGHGVQQRGFARAAGSQQQHPLPGRNLQIQGVQGRLLTVGVLPAEPARAHGQGTGFQLGQRGVVRDAGGHCFARPKTGSRFALRLGSAESAPVAASARVAK